MNPDLCAPPTVPGLVANLLATTDCQASGLVERGYAVLTTPGAAAAALITSLMVIAVALYGYRLLLGRGLVLSDVIRLAVRLGVVLLLAASWSTFQATAYDLFARAPSRIASDLVVAIDAPPPLEGVQTSLNRIEQGNVGWRTRAGIASPLVGGAPTAAMALNTSSFLLTLTTLGLLVVSRVLLALLLAITPIMAGFLLFDATRGILEGWLRALTAAAIVPLFVFILCAIELAILTPLLDHMLAQQAHDIFELDDVTPVALVVILFSLAIAASARAAATIARGIRLQRSADQIATTSESRSHVLAATAAGQTYLVTGGIMAPSSGVARALETASRRENGPGANRTVVATRRTAGAGAAVVSSSPSADLSPNVIRPTFPLARARLPRSSRAANRRDR